MTAGWVAASTRGRALIRRLVGPDGARSLAGSDWPDARRGLATTVYGPELPADADRQQARRAAIEAMAWQLRVLAGWLPPGQNGLSRLFAAPMEIANIEDHLAQLDDHHTESPIRLGSLAVAWPRVAATTSPEQVRGVLATSVWGDPGGAGRASVALGLRVGWARRLAAQVPEITAWATGATAVVVAREQFGFDRSINDATGRVVDELLGRRWRHAATVPRLAESLPKSASWALGNVDDPVELWRAELAVAARVATDAGRLVSTGRHDRAAVAGVMALLLVDLWRVLAAIEIAGRSPLPREVFDAVA